VPDGLALLGFACALPMAMIFAASAIAVSWGAHFTRRADQRLLRALFATFLALTAARMLINSA
jgi:uncharacterized protein